MRMISANTVPGAQMVVISGRFGLQPMKGAVTASEDCGVYVFGLHIKESRVYHPWAYRYSLTRACHCHSCWLVDTWPSGLFLTPRCSPGGHTANLWPEVCCVAPWRTVIKPLVDFVWRMSFVAPWRSEPYKRKILQRQNFIFKIRGHPRVIWFIQRGLHYNIIVFCIWESGGGFLSPETEARSRYSTLLFSHGLDSHYHRRWAKPQTFEQFGWYCLKY